MTRIDRRAFLAAIAAGMGWTRTVHGQDAPLDWQFSYPIAGPGEIIADGFVNLHGYAVGNTTWYRTGLPGGGDDWVQAAIPSNRETGSEGRPATVRYRFLPYEIEGRRP